MTTLFLVLQVVFAVIITISVLLQKSSSIGLGAYSGSNESLFGAKGPAGFLAKFTAFMGILFVINTLVLAYFYQQDAKSSVVDRVKIEANATKSVPNAVPGVPSIPAPGSEDRSARSSCDRCYRACRIASIKRRKRYQRERRFRRSKHNQINSKF